VLSRSVGEEITLAAASTPLRPQPVFADSLEVTLWELVWAVSQVADNEREVIATVAHMLESGSVRLVGNFRDCPIALG
jgi:hypothetical protein